MLNIAKPVDHENKIKVRRHISGLHVFLVINAWTKYTEPRLYCNGEN